VPYTRREEEEEEVQEEAEAPCMCKARCKLRAQTQCGEMRSAGTVPCPKGKRGWASSSASSASSARTRWRAPRPCAARASPQAILVTRFDEGMPS